MLGIHFFQKFVKQVEDRDLIDVSRQKFLIVVHFMAAIFSKSYPYDLILIIDVTDHNTEVVWTKFINVNTPET